MTFGALCFGRGLFLEAAAPRDEPKSALRDISPKLQLSSKKFGLKCNHMRHCLSSGFKGLCNIACCAGSLLSCRHVAQKTVAITTSHFHSAAFQIRLRKSLKTGTELRQLSIASCVPTATDARAHVPWPLAIINPVIMKLWTDFHVFR